MECIIIVPILLIIIIICLVCYVNEKLEVSKQIDNNSHKLPTWFSTDSKVIEFYNDKVKNLKDNFSYSVFLYKNLNKLFFTSKVISWRNIENIINTVKIDEDFDIVIGIFSGGGFIAEYVKKKYSIPDIGYVRIKNYSDNDITTQIKHAAYGMYIRDKKFNKGDKIKYVKLIFEKNLNVKGKKVLIVDDTISTGLTSKFAKKLMYKRGAIDVKMFALYASAPGHADYVYLCPSDVPIFWPWGAETN